MVSTPTSGTSREIPDQSEIEPTPVTELLAKVEARRADTEFMERIATRVREDDVTLRRLASPAGVDK